MADLVKAGELEGIHVLHAVAIGIVAGVFIVLLDNFVLNKVEAMAGLQPLAA